MARRYVSLLNRFLQAPSDPSGMHTWPNPSHLPSREEPTQPAQQVRPEPEKSQTSHRHRAFSRWLWCPLGSKEDCCLPHCPPTCPPPVDPPHTSLRKLTVSRAGCPCSSFPEHQPGIFSPFCAHTLPTPASSRPVLLPSPSLLLRFPLHLSPRLSPSPSPPAYHGPTPAAAALSKRQTGWGAPGGSVG